MSAIDFKRDCPDQCHAGGGVSFLFHAAESKSGNANAGEKISTKVQEKSKLT